MNDIVKRTEFLPADFGDSLMRGIEETRSTISTGGGKPFFRLLRSGAYVFGQTNDKMEPGSGWAVNLATLERGWVCWGDGELLGQLMSSVQAPRPMQPQPVNGFPFAEQYAFEMVCIDGKDEGVAVLYKNNSLGFKKAFEKLISEVRNRYATDKVFYWPIIELTTESYHHKKFGEIFEPVIEVVEWVNADGVAGGDTVGTPAPVEKPPEPVAAPRARQPKVPPAQTQAEQAAAYQKAADEQRKAAEPTSEHPAAAAPVGQRRRPANR